MINLISISALYIVLKSFFFLLVSMKNSPLLTILMRKLLFVYR